MKQACLIIITVLFLSVAPNVLAVSSTSATIETPKVGAPKDEKTNNGNDNKNRGNTDELIPTIAITTTPQPTATPVPVNETRKPTPTPVLSNQNQNASATNTTNNTASSNRNSTSNANQKNGSNSNAITAPQRRDAIRSANTTALTTNTTTRRAPRVLGTNARNTTPTQNQMTKQKQQSRETPLTKIKNIIVPPSTDVQVKGVNYYQDERLSPAVTTNLLYIALTLFMAGMLVLKMPILAAAFMKLKQKFVRSPKPEPFTIPYIGLK